MVDKNKLFEALNNKSQQDVNELVSEEMKKRLGKKLDEIQKNVAKTMIQEESVDYDDVFNAVADWFEVDPEEVDNMEEDEKKRFFETVDKCWDEEEEKVPDACPQEVKDSLGGDNVSESVSKFRAYKKINEIRNYNADELHGSTGQVDGPSKSKQRSAANAAVAMSQMKATNFNQLMSDVFKAKPERARAFQQMIANNPGEQTMKEIANEMLGDSELAKVMKDHLGNPEKMHDTT